MIILFSYGTTVYMWSVVDRNVVMRRMAILTGESARRKAFHSSTLTTTNLTYTDLGSNPSLRGERPAA